MLSDRNRVFRVTLAALVLFILCGCGGVSTPKTEIVPAPVFKSRTVTVKSDTTAIAFKEYELPNKILEAQIDPDGKNLCVAYGDPKEYTGMRLLAIHTAADAAGASLAPGGLAFPGGWIRKTTPNTVVLFFFYPKRFAYYDINTGQLQREFEPTTEVNYFWLKDRVLKTEADTISIIDQDTGGLIGRRFWSDTPPPPPQTRTDRQGRTITVKHSTSYKTTASSLWTNASVTWQNGDEVVILGKGLWHGNVATASGFWYQDVDLMHKEYGKAIAKTVAANVALGILGALSGRIPTSTPTADADVKSGLYSNALTVGDRVYFRCSQFLHCWSDATGEKVWERKIEGRNGIAYLGKISDSQGILVDYGTEMYNGEPRETNHPFAMSFDLNSGEEMWRFVPDSISSVDQALAFDGYCALRINQRAYLINRGGEIALALTPKELGFAPKSFAVRESYFIVIGASNVAVFSISDAGPIQKLWQRDVGLIKFVFNDLVSRPPQSVINDSPLPANRRIMSDRATLWIGNVAGGLNLIDLATGATKSTYALGFEELRPIGNYLVFWSGNRVGVLDIASIIPEGIR